MKFSNRSPFEVFQFFRCFGPYRLMDFLLTLLFTTVLIASSLAKAKAITSESQNFLELLQLMIEQSPDVVVEKARLTKAKALRSQAAYSFIPAVEITGTELSRSVPNDDSTTSIQLETHLNVFRSGADRALLGSRNNIWKQAQAQLEQTILDVEATSVDLLVDILTYSARLELANNLVRLSKELAEIETQRYKQGRIPKQETLKADLELSNAQARQQDVLTMLAAFEAQLRQQVPSYVFPSDQGIAKGANTKNLNLEPAKPRTLRLNWPWTDYLTEADLNSMTAKSIDLQKSPAWQIAEKEVLAQKDLANHLLRQHLPSLDLSLSYGKTNIDIAGDPQWASMAQLSIPLLNLKTVTDYQAQKQQVIIAEARLEKIRQEVMGQWESVLNRLRITVESARARGRGLGVARGLYEDNQRRLRLGRSSLNDVLVDQSRLADAEILAHQGWAAAHRVYTEYCHIQGLRAGCK